MPVEDLRKIRKFFQTGNIGTLLSEVPEIKKPGID
jgi:hypothetical protein